MMIDMTLCSVPCGQSSNLYGKSTQFLSRISTLTRDIDIAILSVCPSVRNVPVYESGLTYGHSFYTVR